MKSEDRRELILASATAVFGNYGYYGATTDQIAKAAGVSQPYVVRMFGTKENLFLEVLERALARLMSTFELVIDDGPKAELMHRLGSAYVEMLRDRGLLLSLMHAFVLGSDPAIGPRARAGFTEVYRFLKDRAGFEPEAAQAFLSNGMMINTMLGLRMTDDFDTNPEVHEMLVCAFPQKLDLMLSLAPRQSENW